jgi:sec1 family domain-containing protein 1
MKESFIQLQNSTNQKESLEILDPVINGLISIILTKGVIPIIACLPGGDAELVAKKLESKLRNLLLDRSNLHDLNLENLNLNRPILLITDRSIDYSVSIMHTWSYRSMVHDIFNMKNNMVKIVNNF